MARIEQNLITLSKKLPQEYQKMSKEDVFGRKLFKNSYKICVYWIPEVARSNLYRSKTPSPESSDVKEPTICHKSRTNICPCMDVSHPNISSTISMILSSRGNQMSCTMCTYPLHLWVFKGSATYPPPYPLPTVLPTTDYPPSYPYKVICSFISGFCDSAPVAPERDDKW